MFFFWNVYFFNVLFFENSTECSHILVGMLLSPLIESKHAHLCMGYKVSEPSSRTSHLPVLPLSSSSSSLSEARKGTAAKSSSSARMRPSRMRPWILQSIPELLHCLIAISMYLWYWMKKEWATDFSDSRDRHWDSGKMADYKVHMWFHESG